jgi:6-phosphogluconolactonase (cycloisomerase 2 family)
MYLLNELGNTLVALQPEPGGTLTEVQAVSTLPPGFAVPVDPQRGPVALVLRADG